MISPSSATSSEDNPRVLLLRLEDACFDETGHGSVEDVDLEVAAGELVAVTGGEGTGKTVLARGCLGLVTAASGIVELLGRSLSGGALSRDELVEARAHCSFASSSAPLMSNQSLRANIALPLVMRGLAAADVEIVVDDIVSRFDLQPVAMLRPEDVLPRDRDLAIAARALAVPARLFVLDEPALPPPARALLLERVRQGAGALLVVRRATPVLEATRVIEL